MKLIQDLQAKVNDFFFRKEVPYGLALSRMMIPVLVLISTIHRWPYVRELYSTDGAVAPLTTVLGFKQMLPVFSGDVAIIMYAMFIVFLITSAIGWCTRLSLWASCLLYYYFMNLDAISTITKYTVISDHVLLLLAVSNCGSIWSVDAWLKGKHRAQELAAKAAPDGSASTIPQLAFEPERFECWPRRLMQFFIGMVYLGAAATKIHTAAYFSGDQMKFWMLTHVNYPHPVGEYLVMFPSMLVLFSYIVLSWEMMFIFKAWTGWGRIVFLTLGIVFHFMTTLTLGLFIFPWICYSAYLAYMNEQDVIWAKNLWKNVLPTSRLAQRVQSITAMVQGWVQKLDHPLTVKLLHPAMLPALLLIFSSVNVIVEHKIDRYGLARAEGRYKLQQLDREEIKHMLSSTSSTLRETDKVFSFDLGQYSIGGNVVPCRPIFKQGSQIIAQASLNPPHGDMWMECNLHYEDNSILDQLSTFIGREDTRANFIFDLCELTKPGKYQFVLKCNGTEVERRTFEVVSNGKASKPFEVTENTP
jgi:hypothetical protein